MLLSKLNSLNVWKNCFNKVNSKTRQRLSTLCFLSNTSKVFQIQIYVTIKLVFSHLLTPDGGDLSIEVNTRTILKMGLDILCVLRAASL